jgi:integrase
MAIRSIHRLKPAEVQKSAPGDYKDGGGLLLRVRGNSASWVFRFTNPAGKRREMGLGVVHRNNLKMAGESLVRARELAEDARRLLRENKDPIDERDRARAEAKARDDAARRTAKAEQTTLARVARAYHERVIEPTRSAKHGAQWIASLENHVPEKLWHAPIDTITAPALLDFFIDVCGRLPETGSRIVQRLRAVFGDAEFRGLCSGNPADAAARKLREAKGRRERAAFAALDYAQVPAFVVGLRQREGIAARALEFALLTAARTGEVLGATWAEIDAQAGIWRVPGARMKGGADHVVYLSARAVAILDQMAAFGSDYVFPSPADPARPLSNMGMLTVLRRMNLGARTTVHGLCRATFSTWAHDTGAARPDVIEACLAHRERDKVKRAYNRAQFAAERKALLAAWADFCDGKAPARNVIQFPQPSAA